MGAVLVIRHGQASFGADDYDVLSPLGWEQGRVLGAWLRERGPLPTRLVRGGLRRHRETLEAIAEGAGWRSALVDDVAVDDGWDEFDHVGVVERFPERPSGHLDRRAFQQVFEQATAAWMQAGDEVDDGESFPGFVARVQGALGRGVDAAAGSGEVLLVVTSGGPIAVAASALLDPPDLEHLGRQWARLNTVLVNTGVTQVVVGSSGPRLLTLNEHPHLDRARRTYR